MSDCHVTEWTLLFVEQKLGRRARARWGTVCVLGHFSVDGGLWGVKATWTWPYRGHSPVVLKMRFGVPEERQHEDQFKVSTTRSLKVNTRVTGWTFGLINDYLRGSFALTCSFRNNRWINQLKLWQSINCFGHSSTKNIKHVAVSAWQMLRFTCFSPLVIMHQLVILARGWLLLRLSIGYICNWIQINLGSATLWEALANILETEWRAWCI